MFRPLGPFLTSLPVVLALAVPAAHAQSSAATQNSSLPDLFGLFRSDNDTRGEVRQAQVQPSMGGSSRIEAEGLPPPGLAPSNMPSANGLPPASDGPAPAPIGNQFGHQFGNQAPAQR